MLGFLRMPGLLALEGAKSEAFLKLAWEEDNYSFLAGMFIVVDGILRAQAAISNRWGEMMWRNK
ncbi:hypothetical protein [Paenibacillus sp. RC67]|uniref:hypothetical protein n=1 Tax=Paenibacillus sp. RC67 TaxID=3039392 RepID=UPI0024AD7136|nr:hypothetical protein [Paenibacillus sp. RC67]